MQNQYIYLLIILFFIFLFFSSPLPLIEKLLSRIEHKQYTVWDQGVFSTTCDLYNLCANCKDRCDMERLKTSSKSCIDLRFSYFWKQVLFRPGWPIKNLITFMEVDKEENSFQEFVVFFNVLIKENTEVALALGKNWVQSRVI